MCGRFTLTTPLDVLATRFGFQPGLLEHVPRYNVAPTQEVLTVLNDGGENKAGYLRWGLVPFWAKDVKIGSTMINARAETLTGKPAFREALQKRRCLVLADGFYEWKKEAAVRIPLRITLKDAEPFAFAGLWASWKSPAGERINSCSIVTTRANGLLEPIHNRMPVVLSPEAERMWLDRSIESPEVLGELLTPFPAGSMEAYEVSSMVNKVDNDEPTCLLPVGQDT